MSFGGPWTNDKLEILRRYLDAYTTALKNQPFNLIYVDAFAGGGSWTPRESLNNRISAGFKLTVPVLRKCSATDGAS